MGTFLGMTEGASATAPIPPKKGYFINMLASLLTNVCCSPPWQPLSLPPPLPQDKAKKVFIPRPQTLNSFWESTADDLVLSATISLNDVFAIQKRFTGYLFHFHNTETAAKFRTSFPRDMKVGVKTHHFVVDQPPPEFNG